MPDFSHFSFQTAIYDTLTGDATLMNLIDGVYDRVPDDTDFPYVTIGDMQLRDWSSKTSTGMEYTLTIHVWSREGGRKESASIMEQVYALLHEQPVTVSGQELVVLRFISSDIVLERDGWSYHGVMQFRALLESA